MVKKSTYALAYEACDLYFSETGMMPTIEAIKPIISINSPTTISTAIKDWKQALSQTIKKHNPELPKPLMEAILGIWEQALLEASNALNEQTIELQAKQTALETKECALHNETKHIQELLQFSEQKYQEEISYLKNEIIRLSTESVSILEQTERYRISTIESEKKNAVLTEQIRQEQDKYGRLEGQYDKEHAWAIKRIEEEKENYKKQIQNEMQRLHAEAKRNRQSCELLQAKLELMTNQANEDRDKIITLERTIAEEKLKLAGLTLNEAKLQNEMNTKEMQLRKLLNKARKKGD